MIALVKCSLKSHIFIVLLVLNSVKPQVICWFLSHLMWFIEINRYWLQHNLVYWDQSLLASTQSGLLRSIVTGFNTIWFIEIMNWNISFISIVQLITNDFIMLTNIKRISIYLNVPCVCLPKGIPAIDYW